MNIITTILILLVYFQSTLSADTIQEDQGTHTNNTEQSTNEEAMLEMLGYITVYRDGFKDLGFGKDDAKAISRGLIKALSEETMDPSYQEKMAEFQSFIENKIKMTQSSREEATGSVLSDNLAKGKEFFEGLAIDKTVKSSPTGLFYKILKKGKSKRAKYSDTVRVHYKGTRIDGTVFDSSYKRGQPADFSLQGVVPGFAEGLTKIGEGGQIILFIPSDLAYGDNPRRGGVIQPGDTLIFECELIKINP